MTLAIFYSEIIRNISKIVRRTATTKIYIYATVGLFPFYMFRRWKQNRVRIIGYSNLYCPDLNNLSPLNVHKETLCVS